MKSGKDARMDNKSHLYYKHKRNEVIEGAKETIKAKKNNFNNADELSEIWNSDCNKCYFRFECDYKNRGISCKNSFIDSSVHDKKVEAEIIDSFVDVILNGYSFETLSKRALKVIFDDAKKDLLKEKKK